jgi:hypothetical protein
MYRAPTGRNPRDQMPRVALALRPKDRPACSRQAQKTVPTTAGLALESEDEPRDSRVARMPFFGRMVMEANGTT